MKRGTDIDQKRVQSGLMNLFNPLRGLDYWRLASAINQFHAGYLREAALIWDAMQRRDAVIQNVSGKRRKSVSRLPWEILTVENSPEALRQKEALLHFYNNLKATTSLEQNECGGLSLLIRQMMDAVGKKFAAHEIVWSTSPDGLTAQFLFCPLWWFENRTGRLRFLPEDFATEGDEMLPGEWLVTVGEGIMESCSVLRTLKDLPLKDWAAFSEKFGMPGVLGKTSAAVGSKEWEAMETAVASLMNDWVAVASNTDQIELLEAKGGTTNLPFPPLVEYCDRGMAALWRGADLSTMSQGKEGVGASLQGDETNLLLEDDAARISETLNEQVDRFVIEYAFGKGVKALAYIKIAPPQRDTFDKDIKIDQFFLQNRIPLSVAGLYERYGRALPAQGESVIVGQPQLPQLANSTASAMAGVETFKERAIPALAESIHSELKPVAARLQTIFQIKDQTEQRRALQELMKDIPTFQAAINKNPKTLQPLMDAMEAAFKNGQARGIEARPLAIKTISQPAPNLINNGESNPRSLMHNIVTHPEPGRPGLVPLVNETGGWLAAITRKIGKLLNR
jgi:hypothetical protein